MTWIEVLCLASLMLNVGLGVFAFYMRRAVIDATVLLKHADELLTRRVERVMDED